MGGSLGVRETGQVDGRCRSALSPSMRGAMERRERDGGTERARTWWSTGDARITSSHVPLRPSPTSPFLNAIRIHATGGREVLRLEEIPVPVPAQGQLLVRIEAVGLNFIETYHRTGLYKVALPFTLGSRGGGDC